MATQIQLRRGTAAQWTTANPVLANGEPGLETDTGKWKFGNGSSNWAALSYVVSPGMPAGGSTGQVLTKNSATDYDTGWATPTGGGSGAGTQLDYAQITANVTVSAATVAAGNTVVAGNSVTYDGTRILIVFFAPEVNAGSSDSVSLELWDGATDICKVGQVSAGTQIPNYPVVIATFVTPAAGAHQWIIKASRGSANGTVSAGLGNASGVYSPAFLRVTKA
jgi:hypothetical protein